MVIESTPTPPEPQRGWLLSGVLLLIILGNAIVIGLYAIKGIPPNISSGLGWQILIVAVPVANIAAGVGIWYLRRWGVDLWVAVSLLAPLLNWISGAIPGDFLPTAYLGSIVGIGVVALLVRRLWNRMT